MKFIFYLSVLFALLFQSCGDHHATTIKNSMLDSFTYSSYRWRIAPGTDTAVEFLVEYYLAANRALEYKAMFKNPSTDTITYSKGLLPKQVFSKLNVILSDPIDSIYQDTTYGTYNGNYYILKYIKDGNRYSIHTNQNQFPETIQHIFTQLDSLIKFGTITSEPFNTDIFKDSLQKESSRLFGIMYPPKRIKNLPRINIKKFANQSN